MAAAVYIFDDIASFSDTDLEVAYRIVSARRREKAFGYLRPIDRKLSVIAELLLIHAVGHRDISLRFVGHDKPVFAKPIMPHFNLSHCNEAVACAVADEPVGVDVEPYDSYREDVARMVFNAEEQVKALGNPKRFSELWTIKESYLKYTGEGLTDNLPELLINAGEAQFATYHSPKGYACTVCAKSIGSFLQSESNDCNPHLEPSMLTQQKFNQLTPIFVGKNVLLNG